MRIPELFLSSSTSAVLIVALLKATIVLALAQWLVASVRSLSAASRHLLLSLALSTFLLIPLISLAVPRIVFPLRVAAGVTQTTAPAEDVSRRATPAAATAAPAPSSAPATFQVSAPAVLAGIWVAGILLLLSRLAAAAIRLRSIVRNAAPAPDEISAIVEDARRDMALHAEVQAFVTSGVAVPMIWGVRNGTLLLPEVAKEWTPEELRGTIVHELGHLQRLDYVALALMNVVASLFWFHPQVWTARRRALTEGEHACDDLVLRSGARASEYASHLLSVARLMPRREPLAAILAMSRPTQLEGRMFAILSPSINRNAVGGKLLMISALGFLLLVAPFATMQLSAEAPAEAAAPVVSSMIAQADMAGHHQRHSGSMDSSSSTGCSSSNHRFDSDGYARAEENLTYGGNALEVQSENGAIRVRRSTGATFGITVCKAAGALDDAAAQQLLAQVRVQQQNGVVKATGPDNGQWTVDYIITVPDTRSITIRNENGPVSFDQVNARIDAQVKNGPLSFRGSQGEIKGTTVNGPVTLSGGSGNIDVTTQNGPLSLALDGPAWVGGELHARVGNGPLKLTVPEGYQTGIALQTGSHSPFHCSGSICGALADQNTRQPAAIKATLGNGPARIFVEGGNGPVNIKQSSTQQ